MTVIFYRTQEVVLQYSKSDLHCIVFKYDNKTFAILFEKLLDSRVLYATSVINYRFVIDSDLRSS